jgi:Glycosyl hydrolase family 71
MSYMISTWGDRTPKGNAGYAALPAEFHAKGLGFMMPVAPQDFRPKDTIYAETVNSSAYRNAWTSAVTGNGTPGGGADWVQLVTWNDYSEHTHVTPSFGTQYGFYDLAAYYISLFKGNPTYIDEDAVYLFFRNQVAGTGAPARNLVLQSSSINLGQSDTPTPSDLVEAVVFTDSGDFKPGYNPVVNITVGGVTTQFKIPHAAMTTFTVPITFPSSGNATVSASVVANGVTNVSLTAPMPINKSIMVQNFLYQSASARNGTTTSCGFPGQAAYQTVENTLYQSVLKYLGGN